MGTHMRKREVTEIGNIQAPKKQLKLTGLVNAPAEAGDERKEKKKDKQEQENKQPTQKYKQCNLRTMMGNKERRENSEKYNREMEKAGREGKGTKKRKKQKNKEVDKQKEKTSQKEIEGRIEATTKQPKAQYIQDMQVEIDGKQVNQVIGKHRYKNNTFGMKDLRYFVERGYIKITEIEKEREERRRKIWRKKRRRQEQR